MSYFVVSINEANERRWHTFLSGVYPSALCIVDMRLERTIETPWRAIAAMIVSRASSKNLNLVTRMGRKVKG